MGAGPQGPSLGLAAAGYTRPALRVEVFLGTSFLKKSFPTEIAAELGCQDRAQSAAC